MKLEVYCKNCNISFLKRASEIKRKNVKNHFCSRRCAVTYNNILFPKRPHNNLCRKCGNRTIKSDHKFCKNCSPLGLKPLSEQTLEEAGRNSLRYNAINVLKDRSKICVNCGYDKAVDCCHIKPVSSFKKESLLSEINHPTNLIFLCKNCHWEFDHGMLKLK